MQTSQVTQTRNPTLACFSIRVKQFSLSAIAHAALVVSLVVCCAAEQNFPCLEGAIGKSIPWSARWQKDRGDDGVIYQVLDVLHVETGTSYTAVLKLHTNSAQARKERHLLVQSDKDAQTVCAQFVVGSEQPRSLEAMVSSTLPEVAQRPKPQFIKYARSGWVRADLPRGQQLITNCTILQRDYLCLEEDKERFGEQLEAVSRQILAEPRIRN